MTKLNLDQIKERTAGYPERIQNAIFLAITCRENVNQSESILDAYDEAGSVESWLEIQDTLAKERKKCDHIHKVIGQWILDGILEDEYYPG